jgi:hypothetical protein
MLIIEKGKGVRMVKKGQSPSPPAALTFPSSSYYDPRLLLQEDEADVEVIVG